MSASFKTLLLSNSNAANFRAWGSAIGTVLAAGGWVKTTDTGQVDWLTVSAPTIGTWAGYEIWRSNDATGGLNEIYVKIEYGATSSGLAPSLAITIGWGSDGAGNILNTLTLPRTNVGTRRQVGAITASSADTICPFSAGPGWIALSFPSVTSNGAFAFFLERTRDSSHAVQDEVQVYQIGATMSGNLCYVNNRLLGEFSSFASSQNFIGPINQAQAYQQGSIGVGLMFGNRGKFTNPMMTLLGHFPLSLGADNGLWSIDMYGATRTYVVVYKSSYTYFGSTTYQMLQLFE